MTRYHWAIALLACLFCSTPALSQTYRFKRLGDSLICYSTYYDYIAAEKKWTFNVVAWHLPSGRKMANVTPAALGIPLSHIEYTNDKYCKTGEFSYEVVAKTANAVLGISKIRGVRLLESTDRSKYDDFQKLPAVKDGFKANEKLNFPNVGCGVNSQKRLYYTVTGGVYSIADDGSDADKPREEIPPVGGLAILEMRISANARYIMLVMAPASQIISSTYFGDQRTWVIRCFDMKDKKPIMNLKPADIKKVQFSLDERYVFYHADNEFHFYDLEEREEIASYPQMKIVRDYDLRMQYTIDGKYLYQVANGESRNFDLKVLDLRNNANPVTIQ